MKTLVELHLPGRHDQKTHGRRKPPGNFTELADRLSGITSSLVPAGTAVLINGVDVKSNLRQTLGTPACYHGSTGRISFDQKAADLITQACEKASRIGKMGKSVVHHNAVKIPANLRGHNISADDADAWIRILGRRNFDHFDRDINCNNRCYIACEVVWEKHSRSAGNIQDTDARTDRSVIENRSNCFFVPDEILVPTCSAGIKI